MNDIEKRINKMIKKSEVIFNAGKQTNEEYMQTCNAEELGCFICEKFFHGACGECRFCEITELRHHCILGEWLKQPHTR